MGGVDIVKDGVSVAEGFPSKVIVATSTNQGDVILIDWLYPFLWEAAQIGAIDVPAHIAYGFFGGGLMWLWENLAEEVTDFAEENWEAAAIAEKNEAHVPNTVEDEGGPKGDSGNVGEINDENFGTDL